MLELYKRQIVKCRSTNQFHRLHIALAARITPLELEEIRQAVRQSYPFPAAKDWAEGLTTVGQRSGKTEPEPFKRRRLKPNLYLYSAGSTGAEKTLIICFPGGARRLMLALPTFLQHFDSSRFDVLMIYRHGNTRYSNGVLGLAGSFDDLMQVLRATLHGFTYKKVVSYGTSGGGVPAILAALHLGLDKGISISGTSLEHVRWRHIKSEDWFTRAKACWKGRPQLLLVFASENPSDKACASRMAATLPVTLYPLEGQDKHNSIFGYVRAGKFKDLLESWLTVQPAGEIRPGPQAE